MIARNNTQAAAGTTRAYQLQLVDSGCLQLTRNVGDLAIYEGSATSLRGKGSGKKDNRGAGGVVDICSFNSQSLYERYNKVI